MTTLALKLKTKTGPQVLKSLKTDSTLKELKAILCSLSNITEDRISVLSGFPPKKLDLKNDDLTLEASGISTGDTLILEEKVAEIAKVQECVSSKQPTNFSGVLLKHIVPADNSCLFTSIYFVLNGKVDESGTKAPWMRKLIADTVSEDPEKYSEGMLGKANNDYCKWIQDDKSWGGAIEISILSTYYGIEIAVVDTINAIINRFGEDQDYTQRVFLLFDGIHYDPLYLEITAGGDIQTIFSKGDEQVLNDAEQLAMEAKSSRQYTDVNKFTLKCLICNTFMSGQVQAQQHAQTTGHMSFGEI